VLPLLNLSSFSTSGFYLFILFLLRVFQFANFLKNAISNNDIFDLLEKKYQQYNNYSYFENDPVSVPHLFKKKEDIEIAAFLTATISWGIKKSIVMNALKLMGLMDNSPYDFIVNATASDIKKIKPFVHRTFNGNDCIYFISSVRNIYKNHHGFETLFSKKNRQSIEIKQNIIDFRKVFFELPYPLRTLKHLSNPSANSASKRINLFLRLMVRNDKSGIDFGIWKQIKPAWLYCPLDVHTARVSRKLGLLSLKTNNWNAVEALTENLRKYDRNDPVKYDFALFGLGIYEKF